MTVGSPRGRERQGLEVGPHQFETSPLNLGWGQVTCVALTVSATASFFICNLLDFICLFLAAPSSRQDTGS